MFSVADEGIVLQPTLEGWESAAVLNPGVIKSGDTTWMFYRAIDRKNVSRIGWAKVNGAQVVERGSDPLLYPEHDFDSQGLEDPRVVEVEGKYYMFYTVYDGESAQMAYAAAEELPRFKRFGIISARMEYGEVEQLMEKQNLSPKYVNFARFHMAKDGIDVKLWQKDAFVFPKKFGGKFVMYHRVLPGIQVIEFEDFSQLTQEFWREKLQHLDKDILMDPEFPFETNNIGGGCPPIETPDGWLFIYHAVEFSGGKNIYHAGVALVDLDNPRKVIGRLPRPLFSPTRSWEKMGLTPYVVFPTGAVVENGQLWVYYGAADRVIGARKIDLPRLLSELTGENGLG